MVKDEIGQKGNHLLLAGTLGWPRASHHRHGCDPRLRVSHGGESTGSDVMEGITRKPSNVHVSFMRTSLEKEW